MSKLVGVAIESVTYPPLPPTFPIPSAQEVQNEEIRNLKDRLMAAEAQEMRATQMVEATKMQAQNELMQEQRISQQRIHVAESQMEKINDDLMAVVDQANSSSQTLLRRSSLLHELAHSESQQVHTVEQEANQAFNSLQHQAEQEAILAHMAADRANRLEVEQQMSIQSADHACLSMRSSELQAFSNMEAFQQWGRALEGQLAEQAEARTRERELLEARMAQQSAQHQGAIAHMTERFEAQMAAFVHHS